MRDDRAILQYWFTLLVWQHRGRLLLAVALTLLTTLFGLALLGLSGWFITATAVVGAILLAGGAAFLELYMPGSGIRFFALGRTVSRYSERVFSHQLVLQQLARVRVQLFQGLARLPDSELQQAQDADWLNRLTTDLEQLDTVLLRFLLPPLGLLLAWLMLSAFFAVWSLPLAMGFLLLGLPILLLILIVFTRKSVGLNYQLSAMLNVSRKQIIAQLEGLDELRVAKRQLAEQQPVMQLLSNLSQRQSHVSQQQALAQLLLQLLHGGLVLCTALLVISGYQHAWFSGPVAVMLVLPVLALGELLQPLPGQLASAGRSWFAAKRLYPLATQHEPVVLDSEEQLHSLSVQVYGYGRVAISMMRPLEIQLSSQQPVLLITGASGMGKSSVAELLLADEVPSSAVLEWNGWVRSVLQQTALQQQLAYLSQQSGMLADTLWTNLSVGLADVTEQQVWQVLSLVEMDEWAKSLPQQLDTWLGDSGQQVSGGQARRINLARWLLRSPQLVILDEPFYGLEQAQAARIWQAIQPWLQGRMVLLLLHHRPDFLADSWPELSLNTETTMLERKP
ncbi:ATP-binding cassette domain-containing protein [Alkalimonas sp.]|uniref:ATP-binding cassette domain-containing protein n=1 Tax=Alkalimonas sp. TaxID=1872453 RepID=UPI00263A8446|nr:ATP-binding cassette domain-containing protein [Alkalimonas sp.]MCC5825644.1 ATP-binding cassette domain-containing protein [Alkalimonas sp.]